MLLTARIVPIDQSRLRLVFLGAAGAALVTLAARPASAHECPDDQPRASRLAPVPAGFTLHAFGGAFNVTGDEGADDSFDVSLALGGGVGWQFPVGLGLALEVEYVPLNAASEIDETARDLDIEHGEHVLWAAPQLTFAPGLSQDTRPFAGFGVGYARFDSFTEANGQRGEVFATGLGWNVGGGIELGRENAFVAFFRYQSARMTFENDDGDTSKATLSAWTLGMGFKIVIEAG